MITITNISNVTGLNGETPFVLTSNPVQTLVNTPNGTVVRTFVYMCSRCSCCNCRCRRTLCNNGSYCSPFWTMITTV